MLHYFSESINEDKEHEDSEQSYCSYSMSAMDVDDDDDKPLIDDDEFDTLLTGDKDPLLDMEAEAFRAAAHAVVGSGSARCSPRSWK